MFLSRLTKVPTTSAADTTAFAGRRFFSINSTWMQAPLPSKLCPRSDLRWLELVGQQTVLQTQSQGA